MGHIIDSHVHLDLIVHHHPDKMKWLKENDCSVVSWSYFADVDSVSHLTECLTSKAHCINSNFVQGVECYYLAGIHPRSIPPDLTPEHVEPLLRPFLDDPLCRGVGEIGLETGNSREQEIFIAQLELGRIMSDDKKIVGVHTPRSNKQYITGLTLRILDKYLELSSSLVIDHCTIDTIDPVLHAGYWAGVTLSPPKTAWDELKRIVSRHQKHLDRIMCNTDSGSMFFEDAVIYSRTDDMDQTNRAKIFHDNAARFFSI